MNIPNINQAPAYNDTSQNIAKMGELLKNITETAIHTENKMMKASVVAQVTGLGKNMDISA